MAATTTFSEESSLAVSSFLAFLAEAPRLPLAALAAVAGGFVSAFTSTFSAAAAMAVLEAAFRLVSRDFAGSGLGAAGFSVVLSFSLLLPRLPPRPFLVVVEVEELLTGGGGVELLDSKPFRSFSISVLMVLASVANSPKGKCIQLVRRTYM